MAKSKGDVQVKQIKHKVVRKGVHTKTKTSSNIGSKIKKL